MKNVWKGMLAGAAIGVGLDGLLLIGKRSGDAAGRVARQGKHLAEVARDAAHTAVESS